MSGADQIRALADSGTAAGEWSAHEGDLEGGTVVDYVSTLFAKRDDGTSTGRLFLTLAPNGIDPEKGEMVVPALTGDGPNAEANAAKIVAAVNALPKVADLIEAIDAWAAITPQTPAPEVAMAEMCLLAARDALTAALGVSL